MIHTCWPGHGEGEDDISDVENTVAEDEDIIETRYFNENNEVVIIFIQNCVICSVRDSIYAFRQCGHQCICQDCYEIKGDIDLLKCVVRRKI